MYDGSKTYLFMLHRSSCRVKRTAFQSWAEELVSKVSDILHHPTFQAAPPTYSLNIWRGGRGQCRVIILKVVSYTFGKTIITNCCLVTGMFSLSQQMSWNRQKMQKNIISILLEFLLPSNIVLDGRWKLCYLGADPSISAHEGEKILTSAKLSDCVFSWILFYSGKAVKA